MRRKIAAGEAKAGQPFETAGGLRLRIERLGKPWTERGIPVCFAYLEPWPLPVEVQAALADERRATWWMSAPSDVRAEVRARVLALR
jgi:hypothetical protein